MLKFAYSLCEYALILHVPFLTTNFCQMIGMTVIAPGLPDFNIYDIREPCVRMGLCYPDDHLWQLLNTYEYRDVMGLPSDQGTLWEECATMPHLGLIFDWDQSYGYKLAPLLDNGVPVLIYNGDQDYICNWIGGLEWTSALVWEGQHGFNEEWLMPWRAPSKLDSYGEAMTGGLVKNYKNFTFLKVSGAGHMVPTD